MHTETIVLGRKEKKCEKKKSCQIFLFKRVVIKEYFNLKTQTLFTKLPKLDYYIIDQKKL